MKKISAYLSIISLLISSFVFAAEPTNLAFVKQGLVHYHDSGAYNQDIQQTIDQAMRYLQTRLAEKSDKKPAIVLDIDETSLSNYPNMVAMNFGGTLDEMRHAEMKGNDLTIEPTLALYRFAKANHVAVFFITGRHAEERTSTIKNLKTAGYAKWDGLTFRTGPHLKESVSEYKSSIRKQIIAEGYDIILNVGDQQSDLNGGYADKSFKLPNPYYFIP